MNVPQGTLFRHIRLTGLVVRIDGRTPTQIVSEPDIEIWASIKPEWYRVIQDQRPFDVEEMVYFKRITE